MFEDNQLCSKCGLHHGSFDCQYGSPPLKFEWIPPIFKEGDSLFGSNGFPFYIMSQDEHNQILQWMKGSYQTIFEHLPKMTEEELYKSKWWQHLNRLKRYDEESFHKALIKELIKIKLLKDPNKIPHFEF